MLLLSNPAHRIDPTCLCLSPLSPLPRVLPVTFRKLVELKARQSKNSEDDNHLERSYSKLRQEVKNERTLRQGGVVVGSSLVLASAFIGVFLEFLDPSLLGTAFLVALVIGVAVTESYNEYRAPLQDSCFRIQDSTISGAGLGLFASEPLEKGTFMFPYVGEILKENEYFDRYPEGNGRYVAEIQTLTEPAYIDGVDKQRSGIARYMNSESGEKTNVIWKKQRFGKQAGSMYFYTTTDVTEGEELFFDYGSPYWDVANLLDKE